jgi:hypothetical protein
LRSSFIAIPARRGGGFAQVFVDEANGGRAWRDGAEEATFGLEKADDFAVSTA